MAKIFKVGLWLIGIVALLLVVVMVAASLFLDPNDFKDTASAKVKETTGRELSIPGDIDLTIFPWLGVELGAVQLSNAPGFGDAPFASIDSATVRVKLLPLLRKQVEMDTVILEGLNLRLARAANGRTNWDDLLQAGAAAEERAGKTETPEQPPEQGAPPIAALALGGLDVRNANVFWDDQQSGTHHALEQVNLRTQPVRLGAPFDVDLAFDLTSTQPAMKSHVDLQGAVAANPMVGTYELGGAVLQLSLSGKDVPGEKMDITLAADVLADLIQQTLGIKGLKLDAAGITAQGELNGSRILDAPTFTGKLELPEFSPKAALESLGLDVPETADPAALTKASLRMQLAATTTSAELSQLSGKLDDTSVNGNLAVRDFTGPALAFDVKLDAIDIDRYLPPPPEGEAAPAATATPATPAAAAAAGAEALPLDTLRSLDVNGTLEVGTLKVANLRTQNIHVTVKAQDGLVSVHPLQAALYQGMYTGRMELDARTARGDVPQFSIDEKLTGVQAAPLLKDLVGEDHVSGTANVEAKLRGRGTTPDAIKQNLNGQMGFVFTNGAVKGINLAKMIRDAHAVYSGQVPAREIEPNQTDFTEMKGTAQVNNGVVVNNDLSAKSPLLRVTGRGEANLVTEQMDYLLTTNVVGTLKGQGGREIHELTNVPIPIRVRGPFDSLVFNVDVAEVLKAEVTQKAKKELGKQLAPKIEDAVKDKGLQDAIKGLFR